MTRVFRASFGPWGEKDQVRVPYLMRYRDRLDRSLPGVGEEFRTGIVSAEVPARCAIFSIGTLAQVGFGTFEVPKVRRRIR